MSILDQFLKQKEPETYEVPGLKGVALSKEDAEAIRQWAQERASRKAGEWSLSDPFIIPSERRAERAKNMPMEEALRYWVTENRKFDSNTLSKVSRLTENLEQDDENGLDSWQRQFWKEVPSASARRDVMGAIENVGYALTDPVNIVPGLKAAGWTGAFFKPAALNAGIGGATNAIEQGAEIAQGVRDEYDPAETGIAAAASGAIGGAAGLVAQGAGRFGKWLNRQTELRTIRKTAPEAMADTIDQAKEPVRTFFGEVDVAGNRQKQAVEALGDTLDTAKRGPVQTFFGIEEKAPEPELPMGKALEEQAEKAAIRLGAKVKIGNATASTDQIIGGRLPKEGLQSSATTSAVVEGSGATPNSSVLLEPVKLKSDMAKEQSNKAATEALFGAPKKEPSIDDLAAQAKANLDKLGKSATNPTKRSRSKKQ